MTKTAEIIDTLVERAEPVRRLRPPLVRAGRWLALAAAILALLAIGHGVRSDLTFHLRKPHFALSMAAALATGILAAVAAFALSLPDRPRSLLLLPAPALAVWIATVGYGCLTDWVVIGPDGVHVGEALRCFATLVLTSTPLAIALAAMLRYAVAMMGGLAIAAITSVALSLLHDLDATAMILIWNLGTAVLITAIASLFGGQVLAWFEARLHGSHSAPAPRG